MSEPLPRSERLDALQRLRHVPGLSGRLHFFVYFLDIAALALTSLAFYLLMESAHGADLWPQYAAATVIAGSAFTTFSFFLGLYDWRRFRRSIYAPFPTIGAVIVAFGALLLIGFLFNFTTDFSRAWLLSWFASYAVYIAISRVALALYLSSPAARSRFGRKAVILGAGDNGQAILEHIVRFDGDIQVIGFLDDRTTRTASSSRNVSLLGGVHLVERLIREFRVDLLIIALPWHAMERIEALLNKLASWRVDIYLAPDKLALHYADRPVLRVDGMPVLSLKDRPISEWNAVIKRIEDLCLAIPALLILSPLLALVALAVKLESKGDVLFVQKRFGFNNATFDLYKFRSMYSDRTDPDGIEQTSKDDPRVTNVGRLIRKTSIDELPQLLNVILGSMSIVGPRPHPTGMQLEGKLLNDLVREYASRHRVKPGITGWAQCNGWRGETQTLEQIERRVQHDLYYIENWGLTLDLLVLMKTAAQLLKGHGRAY